MPEKPENIVDCGFKDKDLVPTSDKAIAECGGPDGCSGQLYEPCYFYKSIKVKLFGRYQFFRIDGVIKLHFFHVFERIPKMLFGSHLR